MRPESELSVLRGLAFDLLLTQLWPGTKHETRCIECGALAADEENGHLTGRGLCDNCYQYWRNHPDEIEPGPLVYDGHKIVQNLALARRIGVCLTTMRTWRSGQRVPHPGTLDRIIPNLITEFGVPADIWINAANISRRPRRMDRENMCGSWPGAKAHMRYKEPLCDACRPFARDHTREIRDAANPDPPPVCSNCGERIQRNNKLGVCRRPECAEARRLAVNERVRQHTVGDREHVNQLARKNKRLRDRTKYGLS
jgi:hypothetical protein